MCCHLVKCENGLGRSTVIDLGAKGDNKFRQVDHRTIEHIIVHNTKFSLRKGGKKAADVDMEDADANKAKWDLKKLAVGNWFSGTRYFRAVEIAGDQIKMRSESQDVVVSRSIVETQFQNANVFSKEEKLAKTNIANLLHEANSTCFTVQFTTKVDEKTIKEKL